jgi:HK97 family phage portal protein
MGIVSRIRPQARFSEYTENLIREIYGGFSTSSGVSVTSDTAMRLITVQNCVRLRAFVIGHLPCHIMEKDGKNRNVAEDFYLYELLHDQPNSWMTAQDFWSMCEAHVSLRGNFYVYKAQLPGRPIRELIPLKPGAVQEVVQHPDYRLTYKVAIEDEQAVRAAYDDGYITAAGSQIKEFPQEKIAHFRGPTLNGIVGMNPIQYARETAGLGIAEERFLARSIGKGLHPGAVIKHPLPLNAPAHAALRENLKKKYAELGQSWDFMLIDENMDVVFPQVKLVDAQYLEQMKMNEAQICGLYRVPLMLIQSGDKAPTYASAEQFFLNFSITGITPDCVNYEKTIRRDLLTPEERKKYYAKFNIDGLLRGDFKTRMEGFQIGVNAEILSPNEAREKIDMNPYKGGDEFRTRTSTVREPAEKSSKKDKGADEA